MRIAVTSNGRDLDAAASPIFGRCPTYIFVDTESMAFEAVDNPAIETPGGAGIQAAQFVIERGAQAVVTGNVGPNAYSVFKAAQIPVYVFDGGTVREVVAAFKDGALASAGGATAPEHAGMGRGRRSGRATGPWGGGRGAGPATQPAPAAAAPQEEIAVLREMTRDLRQQMAELIERLDRLERGS
jgi:predicted Fe-Mo cluster-binding NifX family protein